MHSRFGLTSGVKMDTTVEYKVEFRYYVYLLQSHVYDCNISTCCELRADAFEDNAQKAPKRRPVIIANAIIFLVQFPATLALSKWTFFDCVSIGRGGMDISETVAMLDGLIKLRSPYACHLLFIIIQRKPASSNAHLLPSPISSVHPPSCLRLNHYPFPLDH